jgi:hypothetical protein
MQCGHKHAHEHITECWYIYGRAYENPYMVSHKHAHRHPKITQFGHKHAYEHITGCWYIYLRAYDISQGKGSGKSCRVVISMLMSILQNVGTYMGVLMRLPIWGVS